MLALVGETGSGKSTLAALVARYYLPTSGTILLDGVDTRTVTSESLARVVSVVPQQNFLFSGTVLENIVAGRLDADKQDVGANEQDAVAALESLDCRLADR